MAERLFVRLDDDPLYAPETTVPAGTLREFAVPPALRPWVAHLIAYEEEIPAGHEVHERVLPDGSLHLIFELNDGPAASRLAGARLRPAQLVMRGRVHGLSVKLRPGAVPALFGASAHELTERAVPWDALVAARHRALPEQLGAAATDADRVALLARALLGMRRGADESGLRKTRHAAQLLRAPERPGVEAVARSMGVSERRVQQLFQAHLGLSPREWRRLARLHDGLRLLRRPQPVSWASLAAELGFADQSHLIRDFRALCGLTPAQYLRRRGISDLSKTAA